MGVIRQDNEVHSGLAEALQAKAQTAVVYAELRSDYENSDKGDLISIDIESSKMANIASWLQARGLERNVDYTLAAIDIDHAEEGQAPDVRKVVLLQRLTNTALGPDPARGKKS